MNCEEFAGYLDNYESLTEQEKCEMNKHAEECDECRRELEFFLSMIAAAKSLPEIEPPIDFMEKLNARIDIEEQNITAAKRISRHLRKNWRQYTTAAACFALVAALTANRGLLLEGYKDSGSDGGVISENTVSQDDGNDTPSQTSLPVTAAGEQEGTENSPFTVASEILKGESQENLTPASSSAPAIRNTAAPRAARTETQSTPSAARVNTPEEETQKEKTANESINSSSEGYEIVKNSQGDYGIALSAAIDKISGETSAVEYDLKPEEVSASLRASEIRDNYSLADGGESIAYGVYYAFDKDGRYVEPEEPPIGIGSIKISASDADKAMDVINQYSNGEGDNLYSTNSASLSLMLSELSDEGVSYTDYTLGGSEKVKFRVVFD